MIKFVLLLCLIFCQTTFADCGYSLTTPTFQYTVGDSNPTVPAIVRLERKKDNGNPCSTFFLAFAKGWAGSYNRRAMNLSRGDFLYYNLYKNNNSSGILKEQNDMTSTNEVLFGPISKDEIKSLTFYFTLAPINAGQPPRAGTYIDVVQVQAYSGFYNNVNSYEGFRDLNVNLTVNKFVSLSLVDTGEIYDPSKTSKTLDYGELEENESLEFDVRVVSNAGYILKVASSNNGKLKRVGGTGSKSEISYDFYANNSKKSLSSSASSPVAVASGTGRTASGGARIPVRVVINSVDDKDPGTYQDYLTLSVISND